MLCSTSPTRTEEPSVERCLQNKMTFQSRTISVVKDLSLEEQIFLYEKTRELKNVLRASDGCSPEQFKIKNTGIGVYLIFMENSTRTKESFRNAALFHECKMNIFDSATSSFQKGETITDTLKMLCGYSHHQSVFILRTRLEGVCTAMRDIIGDYCDKMGLPRASFINAGDGKHEHPTQEFLDEFTFLEHNGWDRSRIHVALVGDLLHGRTVHSKVEGLRIYDAVHVDLVAPPELSMPSLYVDAMKRHHFTIRTFPSIDAYLAECGRDGVAPMWYFTRLQIERMGEDILSKESTLRRSITFREELYEKVDPSRTKFFSTLPRHAKYPEIPPYLDTTPLNGWDKQSMNGFFSRIILLGYITGVYKLPHSNMGLIEKIPGCRSFSDSSNFTSDNTQANLQSERLKILQETVDFVSLSRGLVFLGKFVLTSKEINLDSVIQSYQEEWNCLRAIKKRFFPSCLGIQGMMPNGVGYMAVDVPHSADFFSRKLLYALMCTLAVCIPDCMIGVLDKGVLSVLSDVCSLQGGCGKELGFDCPNPRCVTHMGQCRDIDFVFKPAVDISVTNSAPYFRCVFCSATFLPWRLLMT